MAFDRAAYDKSTLDVAKLKAFAQRVARETKAPTFRDVRRTTELKKVNEKKHFWEKDRSFKRWETQETPIERDFWILDRRWWREETITSPKGKPYCSFEKFQVYLFCLDRRGNLIVVNQWWTEDQSAFGRSYSEFREEQRAMTVEDYVSFDFKLRYGTWKQKPPWVGSGECCWQPTSQLRVAAKGVGLSLALKKILETPRNNTVGLTLPEKQSGSSKLQKSVKPAAPLGTKASSGLKATPSPKPVRAAAIVKPTPSPTQAGGGLAKKVAGRPTTPQGVNATSTPKPTPSAKLPPTPAKVTPKSTSQRVVKEPLKRAAKKSAASTAGQTKNGELRRESLDRIGESLDRIAELVSQLSAPTAQFKSALSMKKGAASKGPKFGLLNARTTLSRAEDRQKRRDALLPSGRKPASWVLVDSYLETTDALVAMTWLVDNVGSPRYLLAANELSRCCTQLVSLAWNHRLHLTDQLFTNITLLSSAKSGDRAKDLVNAIDSTLFAFRMTFAKGGW